MDRHANAGANNTPYARGRPNAARDSRCAWARKEADNELGYPLQSPPRKDAHRSKERTAKKAINKRPGSHGAADTGTGASGGFVPFFSSSCWKDVRPEIKYTAILSNASKYPVKFMCAFFEVSRSGYYAFVKRHPRPSRDKALAELIAICQQQTHGTYGYRRICIWLKRQGKQVNHKSVLRVMNKYGLLAQIRRRRKYRQMGEQLHRYANLLNRDFTATRVNQKWVTDISYIKTPQGTLYLSMIRDLFDRSIVAYQMGTEQSINLVLNTIREAKAKEKVTAELQLHSDQGFQYTSPAYFTLTQTYGITPSMSRRGNCYDNAMAENFFSILKTECIHLHKPKTISEARTLIHNYIHFYNHERIQLKTKLTPLEKRRQLK